MYDIVSGVQSDNLALYYPYFPYLVMSGIFYQKSMQNIMQKVAWMTADRVIDVLYAQE